MIDDAISLYSAIKNEAIEEVVIDVNTRLMMFPFGLINLGVVMDHNVKKIFFRCQRYYNDCDFSKFAIKINYLNAGGKGDSYPASDIEISGDESDEITFSWLIHRNAVAYKGYTYFIVKMVNTVDGNEENAFHTTLGKLPVLEGLETNAQLEELYPAEIEAILQRLDSIDQSNNDGASREIEMQKSDTAIQWRYVGDEEWTDLLQLSEIIAEAETAAESKVTEHNVATDSHNDIRLLIQNVQKALEALLDIDDESMNQATEFVAYMKDNRELIEQVTTNKVSVSDIVDDYVTNVSNKPVSAAVAVKLKALIDAIVVPTKTSQLTNDSRFVTEDITNQLSEQIANIGGLVEPMEDDIPKVFIDGTIPTTKNDVFAEMTYVSKTDKFHAYLKIKCQGTSSMSYEKKNFTINMYSDEVRKTKFKKVFNGWGYKESKYVLKANFIDHSHARNIVSARLWSEVVASRSDYNSLPIELRTSPNYGAVDGFPVKVYTNGTYQGLYTWNIGKDDWMWNMNEDNPNHVLMCAETNTDGVYSENACNFRALWSGVHEDDWSIEVGTNSDSVKNSLNGLISCVMNTDNETFMATIENHLDLQSAIDYWIHQYVTCGIDNLAKNMLLATYDGIKWHCGSYDMDSTFGLTPQGATDVVTPDYACPEQYKEQFSLLWEKIVNCYSERIKNRYFSLRKTIYSFSNITTKFEQFMDTIGLELFEEDAKIYPIPSSTKNNIQYIREFVRDRLIYTDQEMFELSGKIECDGLFLNRNEMVFESFDPIQLIATVSPSYTTENVVWESSDITIARVSQGLVTPINAGECTITARCGSHRVECNVKVQFVSLASQITWKDGYCVSGSTGEEKISDGDSASDFINLCGAKYIFIGDSASISGTDMTGRVQFYDIDKNSLGNKGFYDLSYVNCSILDGAVYARITIKTENKELFDVLSDVDLNGYLKLDTSKFIESKEPSASGDVNSNGCGYYDEFIPVTIGQVFVYANLADAFKDESERVFYDRKIVFYDESKTYISMLDSGNRYMSYYRIPDGVAYVKLVTHNTTKDYRYYKVLK